MHSGTRLLSAEIVVGWLSVLAGLAASDALASDGVFTNLNGGSWNNAANWSGGIIATGSGSAALFNALSLSANATVTLDGARTIGFLSFDDKATSKHNWALNTGSGGSLTLDATSGSPGVTNAVTTVIGAALA